MAAHYNIDVRSSIFYFDDDRWRGEGRRVSAEDGGVRCHRHLGGRSVLARLFASLQERIDLELIDKRTFGQRVAYPRLARV